MNTTGDGDGLRRVTGWLFVVGAVAFAVAAATLSSTFDWPDILREPAAVVLPAYARGASAHKGRNPSAHAAGRSSLPGPARRSRAL